MEASITLKKVGKLFEGKTVLAGLNFGIEKGSLVAIIGESNSGKSTLLRVIAGFDHPEYGEIFIQGQNGVNHRREIRKMIGYVPLESDMDPWLTVEQNIRFIGELYGIKKYDIIDRMVTLATELELQDFLHIPAKKLGRSILKRALLLRALIHDPSILILDEPTCSMDSQSIKLTWRLLNRLKGEKTIVYVSKSLSEVESANDRIILLREGRIALDGTTDKLLSNSNGLHYFRIDFFNLSESLYKQLTTIKNLISPMRENNSFEFYSREKSILTSVFSVIQDAKILDLKIRGFSLEDILHSTLIDDEGLQ
ncbi:ABC transporter ATP-binding protein [Candidatus Neomarinimicrobiota bacterium]